MLRAWISCYGVPQALYTDWKNVYVRPPNEEERETGAEPLTQFGRMCAQLGIRIIPASSPQAKGRIERNHGTQQDRLVKKLRRKGIADLETANAFLETEYWADHNARFAQAPAASDDFHVARPRGLRLDRVFRLEEARTVSNDWVVRYDNRCLQLERQSGHAPARSTVVVCESVEGQPGDSVSRPCHAVDRDPGERRGPRPVGPADRAPAKSRRHHATSPLSPVGGSSMAQGHRDIPGPPIWQVSDR